MSGVPPALPDERLRRLLGGDDLAQLRRRLRRHFERASTDAPQRTVRLGSLSEREYAALASLLGRPVRQASSIAVDVAAIDAALARAGIAPSLKAALELLDGPIVHVPTARAEALARWASVVADARHPDLARLLHTARGLGLLKRLARQDPHAARHLRERVDLVLKRLPASGVPRSQIAAETLGDAHALDGGRRTATLVLSVLRQAEQPSPEVPEADVPDLLPDLQEEERDRNVWARAGILVNELARPALFLNLPTRAGACLVAEAGEPAYASLRSLLRSPQALAVDGRPVYVCENPNIVAIAADRLGARCAPLICTDGMPAAAQRTLLTQLARAGARLLYHGDFDWPGLRIANLVIRSFRAEPWRLGAGDYAEHADTATGQPLAGNPTAASWDPSLAPAMQARGLAVPEEAVAVRLLEDLEQ
jgi:uncharacterized protein (TIGR02679 family)